MGIRGFSTFVEGMFSNSRRVFEELNDEFWQLLSKKIQHNLQITVRLKLLSRNNSQKITVKNL